MASMFVAVNPTATNESRQILGIVFPHAPNEGIVRSVSSWEDLEKIAKSINFDTRAMHWDPEVLDYCTNTWEAPLQN